MVTSFALPQVQIYFALIAIMPSFAAAGDRRWWPDQRAPKGLIRTTEQNEFPSPGIAHEMMIQSVAGLAAKFVNEGRSDELVWVSTTNGEIEHWYEMTVKKHPEWEIRGTFDPWKLVDRYVQNGVIKGYILYHFDESQRPDFEHVQGMDESVNVATSIAGFIDGILIDDRLQQQADEHGLKLLLDARNVTQTECFAANKNRFNRRMLMAQDPKKSNCRDLAIAQGVLALNADDTLMTEVMDWLQPLSPILGWDGGDEFVTTKLSSVYGHFQTATDWCMNLPVLMADRETTVAAKVTHVDPRTYDWNDTRSAVSFVLSDGDNVQFLESSFFLLNRDFWNNPDRGKIPFGWSCCFTHLAQLAPMIIDHAVSTRTPNDDLIEWGGGYYYPDFFGKLRTNRWELLGQHAATTWELMRQNDTRIIGFNVANCDSDDAKTSYAVFARETDNLLAIFVFQYSPYEGGAGRVYWVKDRNGIAVPVITARYSIWENSNRRPRSGTPAKVAREIRKSVAANAEPRYDWAIVHAWSYFQEGKGDDESSENLPQQNAPAHGGIRGFVPVEWCAERLPENIRVVATEELAWRIRMQHDAAETKRVFDQIISEPIEIKK